MSRSPEDVLDRTHEARTDREKSAQQVDSSGKQVTCWALELRVRYSARNAKCAVVKCLKGMVELVGIEPTTSSLRTMRSPS